MPDYCYFSLSNVLAAWSGLSFVLPGEASAEISQIYLGYNGLRDCWTGIDGKLMDCLTREDSSENLGKY